MCLIKIEELAGSTSELHIEDWQDQVLQEWEHEFQVAVPSFHFSDELLFQTDFSIEVLPEMINMPGGRMASDSEFVPWRTILGELGQSGGADEPAAERQPDHDPGAPAAHELPWLVHFWDRELPLQTTFPSSKKKHVGADRASDSESDSDFQSIVDHESAIHELYEKRLELSLGEADVHEFTWQLRGGKWTMANKGVAYDAVMASAEKGVAERMCLNYQMTKSASFSTTAYGDDVSVKLAKFWCRKLNHMLEKWVEHGVAEGFVLREVLGDYVEPPEAAEIIATGHKGAAKRVAQIRSVVPQLVPVPGGL